MTTCMDLRGPQNTLWEPLTYKIFLKKCFQSVYIDHDKNEIKYYLHHMGKNGKISENMKL